MGRWVRDDDALTYFIQEAESSQEVQAPRAPAPAPAKQVRPGCVSGLLALRFRL